MSSTLPRDKDAEGEENEAAALVAIRSQSIELRKGLEELMDHIQNHRHVESSESFEERYLMLISSYPEACLHGAVGLTDIDVAREHDSSSIPSCSSSEANLRLPLHLACEQSAPVAIVKSLLAADAAFNHGDHPSVRQADKWGDLPIHIACSRVAAELSTEDRESILLLDGGTENCAAHNAFETIRLLLQADRDKTTLLVQDVYESLPLHTAARYNAPASVISMLLAGETRGDTSSVSSALYTEGYHGQVPLMVACRSGNPNPEVLRVLLEHDDDAAASGNSQDDRSSTILHKDAAGRLPIHVYLLRNTHEGCLRILLRGMLGGQTHRMGNNTRPPPQGRNSILKRGLDAWKRLWFETIIPDLDGTHFYERDMVTRDKLEILCEEIKAFLEMGVCLELVVWKMSCLRNNTGRTVAEKSTTSSTFKQECRIVSGAEIIVPNVLSFLEDVPVETIVGRFRSYGYLSL